MQQHVFSIAEACRQAHIQDVVICPGSRSAPLVYAFTSMSDFRIHTVVDERSAAYTALGIAQHTNKTVALMCTSGTAAANFLPAVAEAYFQNIPLLLLTADRPQELLYQQDGQMIVQQNLYGPHVKKFLNMPCYKHNNENLREAFALTSQAILLANTPCAGPVHINVPLSEPLYDSVPIPTLSYKPSVIKPSNVAVYNSAVSKAWQSSYRKLIVVGQHPAPDAQLLGALLKLHEQPDVVILSDLLSNQTAACTVPAFDYVLTKTLHEKLKQLAPDCIISLGGPVLSKGLKKWLQVLKPKHHFRIDFSAHQIDTYQNVTQHIKANAADILYSLDANIHSDTRYKNTWIALGEAAQKHLAATLDTSSFNEPAAMREVLSTLPDASNVHVGNSSVIRFASWVGPHKNSWILNGNRGTSGIDGSTSTAVGAALVNNRLNFLLTGDVAFLYDIHPVVMGQLPDNLKIIVFNNGGGRIFEWIDGPSRRPGQLHHFTTPHKVSIEKLVKASNTKYLFCNQLREIKTSIDEMIRSQTACVLELRFDPAKNKSDVYRFIQSKIIL